MIQISINKIYAMFIALMVLIPSASFNTNTSQPSKQPSKVQKDIEIRKIKIDLEILKNN
jgi:hypothetical protein